MVYLPTCLHVSVVYVPTCLSVPKACQLLIFKCQRANKRVKVTYGVPLGELKGVPIFWIFLLQNANRNFYPLLLYKKFYITLDIIVTHIICISIIVTHIICISIVHTNCIELHFYTSCHITEKGVEFFIIIIIFFLFRSCVRNENVKRPGFCTLQQGRYKRRTSLNVSIVKFYDFYLFHYIHWNKASNAFQWI